MSHFLLMFSKPAPRSQEVSFRYNRRLKHVEFLMDGQWIEAAHRSNFLKTGRITAGPRVPIEKTTDYD